MSNRSRGMAAATAALACAATLVVGVPAASAHQYCTTGESSGNVRTCINAYYLNGAIATATVLNAARKLRVCEGGLYKPYANCTYYTTVYPGQTISASTGPQPYGWYDCVTTFRLNNDGTETAIGHACIDNTY